MALSAQHPQTTPQLDHALYYAGLGWSVVPAHKVIRTQDGALACSCEAGIRCVSKGKHPAVSWTHYQTNRATEAQIRQWFLGQYRHHGVGIITGTVSGIFVVDVDEGQGKPGADTITNLQMIHGDLPITVQARTGGGGRHLIFKHPGNGWIATSKNVLGPGIDIRGDGGFIVAAPSLHESGRMYLWDENYHPHNTGIEDAPDWLLDVARADGPPVAGQRSDPSGTGEIVRNEWGKVTDGRERHMIGIVCAVIAGLCQKNNALPTAEEVFAEAWPTYERTTASRGESLEADARGESLMRHRIVHFLRRAASGKWKIAGPFVEGSSDEWEKARDDQRDPPHDPETGEIHEPLTATPFLAADIEGLPPREWVYGHFLIRRFLAVLGAPGGAGKTAYAMGIALSVALNRPLLEEPVRQHGPVWVFNLEDPRDELMRRFAAAIKHHRIDPADLEGRLYVDSGRDHPLVVARVEKDGTIIALPIVEELVAELIRRGITLLVVDPFVKSHRLEENRNEHIDFAATLWSQVAERANCAILLLHHFRKGGISGEAASFRGASALIDAARAAVSLATMSEEEADKFGVEPSDRRLMVRADNAKLNLAPPPEETTWFRLVPVDLGNGNPLESIPSDSVQAFERWNAPSPWDGLSMSMVVRILDKIHEGPGDGEQYTLSRRGSGNKRWAGQVVVDIGCKTEGQATQILSQWERDGAIQATIYRSPLTRKDAQGVSVNLETLSKMRQQMRDEPTDE